MGLFEGKKGIIMGVANDRSIASAVARVLHQEGARLGFSHLPDTDERGRMAGRVTKVAGPLDPVFVEPCDVQDDQSIRDFFARAKETMGKIDFLVHSIAFAPTDDIRCPTLEASREGFKTAMDISAYSLIGVTREAAPLMNPGGSVCAMTYFGGEKVMAGYNLMGVCKAALDSAVRYLAWDLGQSGIRINAISAGPLKTLASSAVGDFKKMLDHNSRITPLQRNIEAKEVGQAAAYLLSDMASAITGEIHHVDCGFSIMGAAALD